MSHTKGPWTVVAQRLTPIKGQTSHDADTAYFLMGDDQQESQELANAALIAAAPEMLELLIDLRKLDMEIGSWNDDIDNLIKKAKGGA